MSEDVNRKHKEFMFPYPLVRPVRIRTALNGIFCLERDLQKTK